MRNLGIAAICAALAGCGSSGSGGYGVVGGPAASNWKIERKIDRMTDKPVTSIMNTSKSAKITSKSGFAASIMSLSCDNASPNVSFFWGFPVGRNGVAVVNYRFDALPAQRPQADFFNMEMVYIKGADARTFLQQMAQSSTLLLEISSVTGVASAEFDTSGADVPLAEMAACLQAAAPLPSPVSAPKAKRPPA